MSEIIIRTNGRGNAWPVFVGQHHPYYNKENVDDLANASYSIIKRNSNSGEIENELLIDAGHGTVQYLLKTQNRLPEAVVLTHPHIDHTLSLDWLAQSHFRFKGTKFPVYASNLCWLQTLQHFPQLERIVEFKELLPGKSLIIDEFQDLELSFFPVFHGESAMGAGMIFIKAKIGLKTYKALFTGDLLCPLMRKQDYAELMECDVIYTDSNNRFPYPKSNHWSIVKFDDDKSPFFNEWFNEKGRFINWLIRPNLPIEFNESINSYFETFINEQFNKNEILYSVFDLAHKINALQVNLTHYSGREDRMYNQSETVDEIALENWANELAQHTGLKTRFFTPKVGDEFVFAK